MALKHASWIFGIGNGIVAFLLAMNIKRRLAIILFACICVASIVAWLWLSDETPTVPNSTTIIGSVNQQGGQTFQIIIANATGVSVPKLTGTYVSKNVPSGGGFITSAILHLDSPYPVGALTVEAHGKGVERVTLGLADSMFTEGERFSGKNWAGFRLRNAYGDIRLQIDCTTPEEFQLTAKIN